MKKTAASFSEVRPKNVQGRIRWSGNGATSGQINLGSSADTLENGLIRQVSDFGAFRPGQQIFFWLALYNGTVGMDPQDPWISRVRLKHWWARPNNEFRSPGMNEGFGDLGYSAGPPPSSPVPGWKLIDEQTFGGGTYVNNRAVWFPVPKMIDISEYQTVNPPLAAPARHSDSLFVDDVWTFDLQDPTTAEAQALPIGDQNLIGRYVCFQYTAHGYALGFTQQLTVEGVGIAPNLTIDLAWVTGTL